MGDQAAVIGYPAHPGFFQFAEGKQGAGEGGLVDGMEEIALVLVGVQALEKKGAIAPVQAPDVVAGGYQVGAEDFGIFKEHLKLDFPIAQNVRIGSTPRSVFRQEIFEDVVPVLGGEVGGVQTDAEFFAYRLRVRQIGFGGAVLGTVVLVPVFHEQALHPVTLFLQQQGGYRRIHAAGHADHDKGLVHHRLRFYIANKIK